MLTILIGRKFDFKNSLTYAPFMYLGEFLGGLILNLIQKKLIKKRVEKKNQYFMSIKLIQNENEEGDYLPPKDGTFKILFIILVTALLDGIQFLLWAIYIPKFQNISPSLPSRLFGISCIFAGIYYIYILRLSIYKHHKFSLIIFGVCTIITLIFEFLLQEIDIFLTYAEFIEALAFIILTHIFAPLVDSLEKYLFEYNRLNPFRVLMLEGLFGFFLSFFFIFTPKYFEDMSGVFKEYSSGKLVLFIFLIFLFIILSSARNAFKMITIELYSPMTRILTDIILTPITLLVFRLIFKIENENILYFIINFILSLIISF